MTAEEVLIRAVVYALLFWAGFRLGRYIAEQEGRYK